MAPRPAFFSRWLSGVAGCAAIVVALLLAAPVNGAPPSSRVEGREYDLKAVTIYHLLPFIEWPATAFADAEAPLVIGILGDGPTAERLVQAARGERSRGRPLVVERYASPAQIGACHLMLIEANAHRRWAELRRTLADKPVVTVCDAEQFAAQGGIIQLAISQNKLKLRVNVDAARAAGVTLSAKLLRLSEVVQGP